MRISTKWLGVAALTAIVAAGAVAVADQHRGGERHGWGRHHAEHGRYDGPRGEMRGRWGRYRSETMMAMFEQADADGDGGLSAAEIEAARAARFAEMDADGSGGVDAAELAMWRIKQRAEREIKRRDANSDGVLQLDELPNRGARLMRFDLDENGVVTKTELQLAQGRRGGREMERGWRRGRDRDVETEMEADGDAEQESPQQ